MLSESRLTVENMLKEISWDWGVLDVTKDIDKMSDQEMILLVIAKELINANLLKVMEMKEHNLSYLADAIDCLRDTLEEKL